LECNAQLVKVQIHTQKNRHVILQIYLEETGQLKNLHNTRLSAIQLTQKLNTADSWLCHTLAYPEPICMSNSEYIMRSHIPAHFTKIAVIIEYQP